MLSSRHVPQFERFVPFLRVPFSSPSGENAIGQKRHYIDPTPKFERGNLLFARYIP